jgi:hypothetical protein
MYVVVLLKLFKNKISITELQKVVAYGVEYTDDGFHMLS